MKELEKLLERIIQRININLRELEYDVSPFIKNLVPTESDGQILCLLRHYPQPSP